MKSDWWPLIVVACRHYRLPIPLHLLEGLRKTATEINSDKSSSADDEEETPARRNGVKAISPKFARTTIGSAGWEWIPSSFADFMEEAEHVQDTVKNLSILRFTEAIERGNGL